MGTRPTAHQIVAMMLVSGCARETITKVYRGRDDVRQSSRDRVVSAAAAVGAPAPPEPAEEPSR